MLGKRSLPRYVTAGLVVMGSCAVMLVLAACGSSSSTGSGTSSSAQGAASSTTAAGAGGGIAAAKALVARYGKSQPAFTIKPLPKRPPTGLTVGVLDCTIPTCAPGVSAPAIAKLGWKYVSAPWDIAQGPSAVSQAFTTLLQKKPNFILMQGVFPDSIFAKQFAAAKAAHIPVVQTGSGEFSDAKYLLTCSLCEQNLIFGGKLEGAETLANAGGKTAVAYAVDPTITGAVDLENGAKAYIAANGDGSTFTPVDTPVSDTPQQDAAILLSAIQRNPDIKYVLTSYSEAISVLPQALQGAGLAGKVKLIETVPDSTDLQFIRQGTEVAAVDEEQTAAAYRAVDGLARQAVGAPIVKFPLGWHRIITAADLSGNTSDVVPQPPGFAQAFYRAWHVN
jgi:ABC-type sugar transport system substrate-binding protein